ncbi:lamin tail domain-containing protein [Halogranum amylolyticum]|nr:lamin tail domain-containing protein [Halogranum amylolyticum]
MNDESNKVHHSDLVVDEIRENPSGRDERHLEQEYVTFKNDGTSALDISGWSVEDEGGNTFQFPEDTILDEGDRVTLHSGDGTNTDSDFYWRSDRPLWRNVGDTVVVRDADGVLRIRESYNE